MRRTVDPLLAVPVAPAPPAPALLPPVVAEVESWKVPRTSPVAAVAGLVLTPASHPVFAVRKAPFHSVEVYSHLSDRRLNP